MRFVRSLGGDPATSTHRVRLATWAALLALTVVQLSSMHTTGAWDPWETHYGEVARQMVVRGDPIDLWWQPGQAGPDAFDETTFWSKPALPFWCMALGLLLFDVGANADPAEMVQPFWPELAIRLPSMLIGLATLAFLAYVVAKFRSRRAGLLSAIVLATMPQWAIATRQAITDPYFVAPVTVAILAWALVAHGDDRPLCTRGRGFREVPIDRAYVAFLALLLVAAVLPLAAMHLHVIDRETWRALTSGYRRVGDPTVETMRRIDFHFFIYWSMLVIVCARSLRWRHRSQVLAGVIYVGAGLSLIGKGLIGPGLVGAVVLADVLVSGRFGVLRRVELPVGVLLFALVAFPWHHAMILLRGERFVDELIIVNNLARFGSGEQKQAVGDATFYLQTLAAAAFPWVALVPGGLVYVARRAFSSSVNSPHREVRTGDGWSRSLGVWLFVSFFVVTLSATKYYHYLLPCLPPVAVAIGIWLDDLWEKGRGGSLAAFAVGVVLLALATRDLILTPATLAHLTTYLYTGMWKRGAPETDRLIVVAVAFAVGLVFAAMARGRLSVLTLGLSAAMTLVYVVADYLPAASESWSQRSAMRTYFANRGANDALLSWWFYYRGETYFAKTDLVVQKSGSREKLATLVEAQAAKGGDLFVITTVDHAPRLASHLPRGYEGGLERVYENFHYVLFRVPARPAPGIPQAVPTSEAR